MLLTVQLWQISRMPQGTGQRVDDGILITRAHTANTDTGIKITREKEALVTLLRFTRVYVMFSDLITRFFISIRMEQLISLDAARRVVPCM